MEELMWVAVGTLALCTSYLGRKLHQITVALWEIGRLIRERGEG